MPLQDYDERDPLYAVANISNSTPINTFQQMVARGGKDYRLDRCLAQNTDTVDRTVTIYITDGTNTYGLGSVVVPAGAGGGVVAIFDVFAAILNVNRNYLCLPSTFSFGVAVPVVPAAGKFLVVTCQGGYF